MQYSEMVLHEREREIGEEDDIRARSEGAGRQAGKYKRSMFRVRGVAVAQGQAGRQASRHSQLAATIDLSYLCCFKTVLLYN